MIDITMDITTMDEAKEYDERMGYTKGYNDGIETAKREIETLKSMLRAKQRVIDKLETSKKGKQNG